MTTPTVPTLYHVSYFCSSIPYNLLLELGVPETDIAIKEISADDLRKGADILKVSPRRVVPVMHMPDGSVLCEVGAICMYILENFDKDGKLHPLVGDEKRAKFMQGMFYGVSEVYKAAIGVFMLCYSIEPKDRDVQKLEAAKKKYSEVVEDHIMRELDHGKKDFYLGDKFTAADVMMSYSLMTVEYCDVGLFQDSVMKEYMKRVKARPAYIKLFMPTS